MNIPEKIRGMQDIYGEYQRYFTFLKKIVRHEFRVNGFTRITTPILETRELIEQSLPLHNSIVDDQLYTLTDPKGQKLVLKPYNSPGILRAYIEHMLEEPQPVYLYYIEPLFRFNTPQAGVYRQFHQVGAEIIGESDPILDAKIIYIMQSITDAIGLKDACTLQINTLGNEKEREKYTIELVSFFENKKHLLSESDNKALENDPLQILSSTHPETQELLTIAPKIIDFLKKDSLKFYTSVKEYLDILGVTYTENPLLIRDEQHYSQTVWKYIDNETGATIGSGGRYDTLAKHLGWKSDIPAVEFSIGVERLIEKMIQQEVKLRNKDNIHLYIMQLGDDAKKLALPLNIEARKRGLNSLLSLGTPSIKVQLKKALRFGAQFVIIIGIMEAKNGVCQLKDMEAGTQIEISLDEVLDHIIQSVGTETLSFYHPSRDWIIS